MNCSLIYLIYFDLSFAYSYFLFDAYVPTRCAHILVSAAEVDLKDLQASSLILMNQKITSEVERLCGRRDIMLFASFCFGGHKPITKVYVWFKPRPLSPPGCTFAFLLFTFFIL